MNEEVRKNDYEEVRKAQILENQARLASLGVRKIVGELRAISDQTKSEKVPTLRSSSRLKAQAHAGPSRSSKRLKGYTPSPPKVINRYQVLRSRKAKVQRSKGMKVGVECHHCRQKKLCGEENCKRCVDLDVDQPCLGKSDCSICHSSNGIFCRSCLKSRYGEELEEVRANRRWVCPHCIQDNGINPYWVCNRSSCLTKLHIALPRQITVLRATKMGYKSVAHRLKAWLEEAAQAAKGR